MIVEELYDALIEAGASEAKARAASRAIADMETHFAQIRDDISHLDQKIDRLEQKVDHKIERLDQKIDRIDLKNDQKVSELRSYVDQRFTQIDGTLRLHNWMLGTILAFVIALFFKQFSH
jgi:site-specific recombinase